MPESMGLKTTSMLQLLLAVRLAPQLLVWANSPLAVMLVILRLAFPLFVRITVCGVLVVLTVWAAKEMLGWESATTAPVPEPARPTVCGLLPALSVRVKVPVRVPTAVGVKLILNVQVTPGGTLVPQLLVCAKSPLTATALMLRAAVPLLIRLT